MPKIRLSALATDIKGKSGGSVFSTNSGGTYFRNNPSGGGKQSNVWNLRKSQFAALSSSWRNLTRLQIDAWNAVAPEYPTVNAFGEPRIPSGFELYMRLNSVLVAHDCATIVLPLSPEAFPLLEGASLVFPDADGLWSTTGTLIGKPVSSTQSSNIFISGPDGGFNTLLPFYVAVHFRLLPPAFGPVVSGTSWPILQFGSGTANLLNIKIVYNAPNNFTIEVKFIVDFNTHSYAYPFIGDLFNGTQFVSFNSDGSRFQNARLGVRGGYLVASLLATGTIIEGLIPFTFLIGGPFNPLDGNFIFVDGQWVESFLVDDEDYGFGYGNQPISPGVVVVGDAWSGFTSPNLGSLGAAFEATLVDASSAASVSAPLNSVYVPPLRLKLLDATASEFLLTIIAASPESTGKSAISTRTRIIRIIPSDSVFNIGLSEDFLKSWVNVPNNSLLSFTARLINPRTGQSVVVVFSGANGTGRKARFKTGSEIAGAI